MSNRRTQTDPSEPIAALFDEHCDFVCRVLRHHGIDEATLDDAVQDVFVTAYRRWSTFEGRSSARSWLFGIARRIAYRYRRGAANRARHFSPATEATPGSTEPFARVQAAQSLSALLARIDGDKRSVFVLRELEGMTAPEIAEALSVPVGTVYSRLRAAWQGLGQEAERERARLRVHRKAVRAPAVDPERRRRMWGLIVGGLGSMPAAPLATTTAASTWLAPLKWVVVGGALAAGMVGARALATDTPKPAATQPAHRATPAASPAPAEAATADLPRPALPSTAPVDTEPAPVVDRPTQRRRPPAAATPPPTPEPETTADTLAAELALLRRAQAALTQGKALDALSLLGEHARLHPGGQLADERRRTRIKALCAADRHPQARAESRALHLDFDALCPR